MGRISAIWGLFLLLCVASCGLATADSFEPGPDYVYDLIYDHKTDVKACVRLLHSEGEVGCSSPEGGSVGSLYPIETEAEYLDFKDHMSATWTDLKAIVLAGHLFNKTIIDGLHQTKAVVGIALLPSNATGFACGAGKTGFSPAEKYPNKKWGLHPDSSHDWNPCGNAWFMEKLPFPVFSLNSDTDGKDLVHKARENKRLDSWPKWSAEFKAFMWGAGDSNICLRRGYCDPVGGQSVWGSFEEGVDAERDIVLVMSQLDSNSIFQDLALGAEATASGITTLLTAIHALADQRKLAAQQGGIYIPPVRAKRQLVFGFWTGETFGYVGSRRFVEDLIHFKCKSVVHGENGRVRCADPWMTDYGFKNISLSRIHALIDLQQLGQLDAQNPTVYVHREANSQGTAQLLDVLTAVAGSSVSVKPAFEPAFELPPSSLHSFLLANSSLPALLLSDFSTTYRNPYFQSRWDDWNNVNVDSVCTAAGLVARALYQLVHDVVPPQELKPNCTLVHDLLDCLVRNNTCDMKRQLLGVVEAPNPPTGYAGLYRHDQAAYNINALLVHQVLNWVTSPQYYMPAKLHANCSASSHCPEGHNMECVSGVCRNSSVFFHDAAPFGLEWDANWAQWSHSTALFLGTHPQPLWTEPTWDTPALRVFKREQFIIEVLTLVFGLLVFSVALGFLWLARRSLNARFKAVPSSASSSSSSSSSSTLSLSES